jgi:hypothetical protein
LDADFLNGLGELVWLDSSVIVEVEVLECLLEDGFLGLSALSLLGELVLEFSFETGEGEERTKTYLFLSCSMYT